MPFTASPAALRPGSPLLIRKRLRGGRFTSSEHLRQSIESFIACRNTAVAKRFRWTMTGKPLALVHLAGGGRDDPSPDLLCEDPPAPAGVPAPSRPDGWPWCDRAPRSSGRST